MKITLKNLGALKQAEFMLGELTIICGGNNTGKTYATHATYAFLEFLRSNADFPVPEDIIDHLFREGGAELAVNHYVENLQKMIDTASKKYSEVMFRVFAGNENQFSDSTLQLNIGVSHHIDLPDINIKTGSVEKDILEIRSSPQKECFEIELIIDKYNDDIPTRHMVKKMISDSINHVILKKLTPKPFLASAERTGAAIFQKELDFTKNRLVEMIGDKTTQLDPLQFLRRFGGEYPIAVRDNVDFIRELPALRKRESILLKEHPEILDSFKDIIGGEYKVSKDGEIQYIPTANKRVKLSLVESSSAVRSLLDIGFYLRHIAAPGDLLMVDEPELNLHPENQRRIARLFSKLVNIGIKVFITTHSDYIIKELNTLIMLNQPGERFLKLARREGYEKSEFLDSEKVKVYIAEKAFVKLDGAERSRKHQTLSAANIDKQTGIEARSFDTTIEDMNRVQEEIVWGGDE